MDSFYEQPRTAPIPTSTEKIPTIPTVPEVSMIFQNNLKDSSSYDSMHLSYNKWKTCNQLKATNIIKNNPKQTEMSTLSNWMQAQCMSKQVRFENPYELLQQPSQEIGLRRDDGVKNSKNMMDAKAQIKVPTSVVPFEQIYMGNIPNRNLDLSVIEYPKGSVNSKENLENIDPNRNLGKLNETTSGIDKNYLSNCRKSSGTDADNANNAQYTNRPDCFGMDNKVKDGSYRRIIEEVRNDPFEKNHVIDLLNYKRGNLGICSAVTQHHYALDNTKMYSDKGTVQNSAEKLPHHCNCFISDSCESTKHSCGCTSNKHLPIESNAQIQTEIKHVHPNVNENTKITSDPFHNNKEEPSVKDLLKIIHQQNDQLLILQKQVATLLNSREIPAQVEAQQISNTNLNIFGEKCRTSTQLESQGLANPLQHCHPRKPLLPQFSLDVMTSFEVSIRRQQNLNRAYKETMNQHPRICEVSETESNAFSNLPNSSHDNAIQGNKSSDNTDVSLTLNEPVHVPEPCPSPINTVRIDMEDYSSDDEEDNPGDQWFYKNVKGQVNQILRKSGIWPNCYPTNCPENPNDVLSRTIRNKVKEATIKHLKSVGVHVPTLDEDDALEASPVTNMEYNPNDISFVVKQLLMKYLPSEQLTKLVHLQTHNTVTPKLFEDPGLIKRRPDFSFATVQYMQKYNLLGESNKFNQPQREPATRQNDHFDRILDVTAIRQQPKLL